MYKRLLFLLLIVLAGCSQKPVNLSVAKKAVMEYYESGRYDAELNKIVEEIEADLMSHEPGSKDLVVFDVDETSLSNYDYIKGIDFGYDKEHWNQYMLESSARPIKPVLELYKWLISNDIHTVFLTGRVQSTYEATKRNLIESGFAGFDTLICRSHENENLPADIYKSHERAGLTKKGYRIIATIGDLHSDLEGENTGRKYKLPNYLYSF